MEEHTARRRNMMGQDVAAQRSIGEARTFILVYKLRTIKGV